MKTKLYIMIAVALGILQLGMVHAAAPCLQTGEYFSVLNVMWGNATHPMAAGPGQMDVPLTVTLEGYGNSCTLYNVEGQLGVSNGFYNFNGSSAYPTYNIQQLAPSAIFNMEFNLNIANTVSVGPNATDAFYLYIYYNYSQNSTIRSDTAVTVDLPMYGSPNLVFTARNPALEPGVNNFTITLTNTGTGKASSISTSVSSSSGVGIVSQPAKVDELYPGASANMVVPVYVPLNRNGTPVTLNLNSHYISPYGYNTSLNSQLSLYEMQNPQSILIYAASDTLVAGRVQNESITIANPASSPIYNVSVTLTPQSPLDIIGNRNYLVIPEIAADGNVSFPVSLYPQASSSSPVSTLDIALTYTLDNQDQSVSRSITFLTPGYVDLTQVSTSVLPAAPTSGAIFSITSTLDNLGSQSAGAATIVASPPPGILIEGQNTTFIGSIPVGTPTAFTLSFRSTPGLKSGIYRIPVRINYLNDLNQPLNTTLTVSVQIGSGNFTAAGQNGIVTGAYNGTYYRRRASGSFPWAIVVLVVVILGVVAYYLYRRRAKKRAKVRGK